MTHPPMPDIAPSTQFAHLRTGAGRDTQITHLIRANPRPPRGTGGTPGNTLCGLTRFDRDGVKADIGGWSVGGGWHGPGVEQIECALCKHNARLLNRLNRRARNWRT